MGGGSQAAVFEFTFADGMLTPSRVFPIVPPTSASRTISSATSAFDPAGHLLYAADLFRDSIVVINPQSGMLIDRFKTGRRPYRILFHPDGKTFFVSSWADGTVYHQETEKGGLLARIRLGAHPTDMVWLPGVPAAAREASTADENLWRRACLSPPPTPTTCTWSASPKPSDLRLVETINLALTPCQPLE